MKTLKDYSGVLSDYEVKERAEILSVFLNEILNDLNISLNDKQMEHFNERLSSKINNNISIKFLQNIINEIVSNYKQYLPFCWASIIVAVKRIS